MLTSQISTGRSAAVRRQSRRMRKRVPHNRRLPSEILTGGFPSVAGTLRLELGDQKQRQRQHGCGGEFCEQGFWRLKGGYQVF